MSAPTGDTDVSSVSPENKISIAPLFILTKLLFMKPSYLFLLFVLFLLSCNKEKKVVRDAEPFNLTVETLIKSDEIFAGSSHYIFTNSSIYIYKSYPFIFQDTAFCFYMKIKNTPTQYYLSNLKLDTLKNIYKNEEILDVSGQQLFIDYENNKFKKRIWLSNYYLQEIKTIVDSMNVYIPDEYKIH